MIKLRDVSKYYRSKTNVALGLHKINLEFEVGDFVAVTGESGSGKSTLLNVLSGMDTYDDGELYFDGGETSYYDESDWENYRREKIGFIYQNYNLIDSFSVIDNVRTAILILHPEMKESEAQEKALCYLEKTGLKAQAQKKASHLSSGQKQRLSIARALAKETDIIVADEPTGNLDAENSRQIVKLLSDLSKDRLVIMVTHNYEEVRDFATRKIRMYNGEVGEDLRLKPNQCGKGREKQERKEVTKKEEKKLAGRLLRKIRRGRPHSAIVITALFLFLFSSMYLFFGTFLKNLDFSTAKNYSDRTYVKEDRTRISVKKPDGSTMDAEDLKKIRELSYVVSVDLYDVVNDISYVDTEGTDYRYGSRAVESNGSLPDKRLIQLLDDSKKLRTATSLEAADLSSGKLPEKREEIVISSEDTSLVGTEKKIYLNRKYNWDKECVCFNAVIAGVTDEGETGQIYLSEEFSKELNVAAKRVREYSFYGIYADEGRGLSAKESTGEWTKEDELLKVMKLTVNNPVFLPNDLLSAGEIRVSETLYDDAYQKMDRGILKTYMLQRKNYLFYGAAAERQREVLQIQEESTEHTSGVIEISRELFDKLYPNQNSHQISAYIRDYAYTDRVIKKLEQEGYEAISTFRAASTDDNWEQEQEQTAVLLISLASLAAVFGVGIFILRLLMNSRKKEYHIMVLLGMNRRVIDRMNRMEIAGNTAAALVFTILSAKLAEIFDIPLIAGAVRCYRPIHYLIYTAVMAAMMLLLARAVRVVKKKLRREG